MSATKAVLCGYYGMGNAGDEALLVSLLQMLPKSVTPIVLSGNPSHTKKQYGVASCPRKSTFAVLNALGQSDIFIWGGGSLMQDATSLASPIYYAGLMALAQQRGLKTIAWAQGIGPLRHSLTRWLTKQVLLGCNGISVRDRASEELLRSWGIEPIVAPDPVWAMTADTSKTSVSVAAYPAPRVAVVLRSHPLLTTEKIAILIAALKQFQAETNCCLLLIPFQPAQDLAIAEQISAAIPHNIYILSINDPQQLLGLFAQVKMTIGMRLHSLIMAASVGCSCFALSYDPKVTQLMTELQLPGWELEQLPQDVAAISQQWSQLFNQDTQLNSPQIRAIIDRALTHQELLQKLITNY